MEDSNYVLNAEVGLHPEYTINDQQSMSTYLKACCKVLIEMSFDKEEDDFLRFRVDFLHRSVKDLLNEHDIVQTLKARTAADFKS